MAQEDPSAWGAGWELEKEPPELGRRWQAPSHAGLSSAVSSWQRETFQQRNPPGPRPRALTAPGPPAAKAGGSGASSVPWLLAELAPRVGRCQPGFWGCGAAPYLHPCLQKASLPTIGARFPSLCRREDAGAPVPAWAAKSRSRFAPAAGRAAAPTQCWRPRWPLPPPQPSRRTRALLWRGWINSLVQLAWPQCDFFPPLDLQ